MKKMKKWIVILVLSPAAVIPWASAHTAESADCVFPNGVVHNMETESPKAEPQRLHRPFDQPPVCDSHVAVNKFAGGFGNSQLQQ